MIFHMFSNVLNENCYGILIFVLYGVNANSCKSSQALILASVLIVAQGVSENFVDWNF